MIHCYLKVNCQWSTWSQWECTSDGYNANRARSKQKEAMYGGTVCFGTSLEEMPCKNSPDNCTSTGNHKKFLSLKP